MQKMQRSGLSSETPLKTDLEQSKEAIKSEIHKQLKLKEGAENFKKVATDKKTKARCISILKEANVTIQDLHDGLQYLNARLPEDVFSENDDSLSPDKTSGVSNGSGSCKIEYLKKEMAHEMKFKKGAENLHAAVCSDSQSKKKDSKRTAEVKRPLEDSRRKVEIIRMALLREQRQGTRVGREDGVLMGDSTGKENDGSGSVGLSPLELRVEDVRYRIEIESSVMQGANIMIKSLSESGQDKGLVEAKEVVHESRQILDLLHCSLSRLIGEQFPQQAALGIYKDYNILPSNADRKSEALTGVLDVCIIGADRLLADVPNRDPRKLSLAIVSSDGKIVECTGFNKRKRGCTKWSLDKSLSVEICSVLKLDNIYVGQTSWNALGTECWKERFHILLDKSRELEVGVYWRDYRSLCGVAFLRLEEFLDNKQHQI